MNLLEFEQNATDNFMRAIIFVFAFLGVGIIVEVFNLPSVSFLDIPVSPIFMAFPPLYTFKQRGRELNDWYGEEVEHLVIQDAEERGFDWRAPEIIRRAVVGRMLAVERMNAVV